MRNLAEFILIIGGSAADGMGCLHACTHGHSTEVREVSPLE